MLILVDTYNLYHTTRTRRENAGIAYDKMLEYVMCQLKECTVTEQIAYIARMPKADPFIRFFQTVLGFFVTLKEIRPSKADNFDVELTLDALKSEEKVVVICSSSKNLVPLIQELQAQKRTVYVFGSGIPREINNLCVARELPLSVLKVPNEKTRLETSVSSSVSDGSPVVTDTDGNNTTS